MLIIIFNLIITSIKLPIISLLNSFEYILFNTVKIGISFEIAQKD